jgi:alpha-L-fucosidase 2
MNDHTRIGWDGLGRGSWDGLPCGNGDLGVVAWGEAERIGLLLASSDAWDGLCRLPKIGRVMLHRPGGGRHELDTASATIALGDVRVWVDAHAAVVHITGEGPVSVELDPWRAQPRQLDKLELHCVDDHFFTPEAIADEPLDMPQALAWWRCNRTSIWPHVLTGEGLADWTRTHADPLLHRACGAVAWGDGFVRRGARLEHGPGTWRLRIAVHRAVTADAVTFTAGLTAARALATAADPGVARAAHDAWWTAFWARSWVITGQTEVDRGYRLARYLVACCGRGAFPIKFNGALFTTDWPAIPNKEGPQDPTTPDADYRRWGGAYWFQNTRLPYWAMLGAGDHDLVQPLFTMYREALPLAEERCRRWYGHGGAFFIETMYFWGSLVNKHYDYGCDRSRMPYGHIECQYLRTYFQCGLELLALGLAHHRATGDAAFATRDLLPLARAILRFYHEHTPRTDKGRLHFAPAQALETYQYDVIDPLPEIAGLRTVIPGLLALTGPDAADRAAWSLLLELAPEVPVRDGRLRPARVYQEGVVQNCENPELYAVFPYRHAAVGGDPALLAAGRAAFAARLHPGAEGWRQCAVQAAMLGLADEAWKLTSVHFTNPHGYCRNWMAGASRFPWWGPNFDWLPDMDQGAVGQLALQSQLVQHDGERLHLLPAWPLTQDVSFRLHAGGATVDAQWRGGRFTRLDISPAGTPVVMPQPEVMSL